MLMLLRFRVFHRVCSEEVFDFTDKPEMLQACQLGLQLHSNGQPQEYHFRSLLLTEEPEDKLVTVKAKK